MNEVLEPVYLRVASALKVQRSTAGFSQAQIASILKIPTNTYRGYENGIRRIQLHTLIDVARYYNLSVNYFMDFGLESEPTTNKIVIELEDSDIVHAVNDLTRMDNAERKTVYNFMQFVSEKKNGK